MTSEACYDMASKACKDLASYVIDFVESSISNVGMRGGWNL